jgi:DNA segregation ATPase FtsK/SpoIIIE, S-DNA-T family
MAKSSTSNSNAGGPSFQPPRYRPRWLVAVACLLFGLWLTVAYLDYDPQQRGAIWNNSTHATEVNLVGELGADMARISFTQLGLAAWLVPLFSFWALWLAVRNSRRLALTRFVAMAVAIATAAGLAAMLKFERFETSQYFLFGRLGGSLGYTIYDLILADVLGLFGSASLLATIYVVAWIFIFTRDIGAEFDKFFASVHAWRQRRAQYAAERAEAKRRDREAKARAKAERAGGALAAPPAAKALKLPKGKSDPLGLPPIVKADAKREPVGVPMSATMPSPEPEAKVAPKVIGLKLSGRSAASAPLPEPAVAPAMASAVATPAPASGRGENAAKLSEAEAGQKLALNIVKPEELKKARAVIPHSQDENYQFPKLSLLKEPVRPHADNSEEEHQRNAANLLRILGEFGVEVTIGEIHVGPVITRYEVAPAPGVRVEKIAGLDKNIALGMRAQSVRILAPIPGKAAVGVEVPNQHPTPVGMREIIESEDWVSQKAELPIALGKDVSGKPLVSDLAKMPHLLIAGATGSGKSVCINSIVASILYSKSPKEVRLLMVDPKVVELKVFNSLPHMLIPVVTEPKKVPGALKWLLNEMEKRYQMFAKCNVRNIVGYNNRKRKDVKPDLPAPVEQPGLTGLDPAEDDTIELPERLPYVVAIIDELADLMMVAPAEIETSIARLAQLARAAGIHLIIATQRPSVNVITGVIKANLPSRIAFQVASQVDSRTILDTKGADTLIGRGDMLFSPPGTARLVRAQGAFVSDDEIMSIVEFLKVNGPPIYAQDVQAQIDRAAADDDEGDGADGADGDLGDDEELYQQALAVLKSTRRASTSMIQRRLRIGYNRAARIMDLMEDKGVVGPENGSSPRDILVDLDSL